MTRPKKPYLLALSYGWDDKTQQALPMRLLRELRRERKAKAKQDEAKKKKRQSLRVIDGGK